ncbi:MAG TPA: ATP-binding cassette domain-containing protein [Candidatus Saccharimonadales bacterium]|jgi:ABC-2 type transport system ATP-binding protein
MPDLPAFSAKNVYKYYGNVHAVDNVSLSSKQGQIFSLLGPNGAGKTTLVNMLSTLVEPNKGKLQVLGVDVVEEPEKVRELVGLAGQFAAIDEYLTGAENIYMVARLYHLSRSEAKARTKKLLDDLRLNDAADRQVRTYSGGMRRRLDLGASLVGHPKVLLLDEPTTGLDPRTRSELWVIIRDLVKEGTSILLTTQYLEEADELADHIAVIDRGKLISEGTSRQLKAQLGGDVIKFELANKNDIEEAVKIMSPIAAHQVIYDEKENMVNVPVGSHGSKKLIDVVRALDQAKITPNSLALHEPTLDDVFLNLTGVKASEVAEVKKTKAKWGSK